MAHVVNKTTLELRESVNTPDYDPATWYIINRSNIAELAPIKAIPQKYRKFDGSKPVEMTAGEKAAVDAAQPVPAPVPTTEIDAIKAGTSTDKDRETVLKYLLGRLTL